MKTIFNYIIEAFANSSERKQHHGTPDRIKVPEYDKYFKFNSDTAHAFIYDVKTKSAIWGKEAGGTHDDLIRQLSDAERKEHSLENIKGVEQLRWDNWDLYDMSDIWEKMQAKAAHDSWVEQHKELVDRYLLGRVWHIPTQELLDDEKLEKIISGEEEFEGPEMYTYIAWWNELETKEFNEFNQTVISQFNKKFNTKITQYYSLDNNGNIVYMDLKSDKQIEIEKRTAEGEVAMEIAAQLHTGVTAELRELKRQATSAWRHSRDAHFQREYYNKTDSKTAAEWHHKKTKRYNTVTGKMEWGEKIGDSLVMKDLKDYICESSSQIKQATANLKMNFDVDPLDNYVYLQDEIDLDDTQEEKDIWIRDEVEQIIIDIRNVDKDPWDYTHNKDWKTFMKCFKKEYKKEPYYELALQLYNKIEEYK